MNKIVIIGAGSWGIAIAHLLSKNGHEVKVYGRDANQVKSINSTHRYSRLPGLSLDKKIIFTSNFDEAVQDIDIVVIAVPSNAFREVAKNIVKKVTLDKYFVTLTKGMEDKTLYTMSEILEDELKKAGAKKKRIVAISGPTHAEEVAVDMPSMVVSASKKIDDAKYIQDVFMNENFRVYTNTDIKGVEICAAFKNIIALASGILYGVGYGDNIKAAMITRGLAEMIRAGKVLGCKKDTFYGLAGLGDMVVTATSVHSRNYQCGKLIGEGYSSSDAIKKIGMVVEGVNFLPKAMKIIHKYKLDLPITTGINEIVINGKDPKKILTLLMTRSKKSE